MRSAFLGALVAGATTGTALLAQPPAISSARFEVVSIKLNKEVPQKKPNAPLTVIGPGGVREPPSRSGRVAAQATTARALIRYAYGAVGSNGQIVRPLEAERVIGGPSWIDELRFDLDARMDDPSRGPADRMQMMRTLLEERFDLQARHASRTLAVYNLTFARPDRRFGPSLHELNQPCTPAVDQRTQRSTPCAVRSAPGNLTGHGVAMAAVATYLSPIVGRIVVDRTGLSGRYDLSVQFAEMDVVTPSTLNDAAVDGPSIFTALSEQLGLRLESARAPVDVVVIDHIERPTPN
jgi:uncharacterized protein (TIGR03435 family)